MSYSKHEPYFDVSTQRNVSSVEIYTNMQKKTVKQIYKYSITQIYTCTNIQINKYTNEQIYKYTSIQI